MRRVSCWLASLALAGVLTTTPALGSTHRWTLLAPNDSADAGSRQGHTAVLDGARSRMLVYGGRGAPEDLWALTLAGDPRWKRLELAGPIPLGRSLHTAVVDPEHARMLVFGGLTLVGPATRTNELWALSLTDAPTWEKLSPAGPAPRAREGHAAIYDPARRRMLVYGGMTQLDAIGVGLTGELWELDCGDSLAWHPLTTVGSPTPLRYGASWVLDEANQRAILFGGWDPNGLGTYLNDVWSLSLTGTPTWTRLTTSGTPPGGRFLHAAAYDPGRQRMIVTGGNSTNMLPVGDTWELTLGGTPTWTRLADTTPLTSVGSAGFVLDPSGDRIVRYGGGTVNATTGYPRAEVMAFDLASDGPWTTLSPVGAPATPSPQAGGSLVIDPVARNLLVDGGSADPLASQSFRWWATSLDAPGAWISVPTDVPDGWYLNMAPAVVDPIRHREIKVYPSSRLLQMSLDAPGTWQELTITGTPPSDRAGYSVVADAARDRVLLVGGHYDSPRGHTTTYYRGVWELTLGDSPAWTQLVDDGPGTESAWNGAFLDVANQRLCALGMLAGTWGLLELDLAAPGATWSLRPLPSTDFGNGVIAAAPERRRWMCLDLTRGTARTYDLDDSTGWQVWDVAGGAPSSRERMPLAWDDVHQRWFVFGGTPANSELWSLELGDPVPTQASLVSADASRDRVRLRWWTPETGVTARLDRSTADSEWSEVARLQANASGELAYDDREIAPGGRYGYRLVWSDGTRSAEVWLDVPDAARLRLAGARPNPTDGRATIAFSLPGNGPATLELLDLGGRRVSAREVGALGAGEHVLALSPERALAPGVYFARLAQGAQVKLARVVVCR